MPMINVVANCVMEDGKWGYVNTNGEMVISPEYYEACSFKDGLARVKTSDSDLDGWTYINKSGRKIAGNKFITLILVIPSILRAMAIISSEPTQLISLTIASLKNAATVLPPKAIAP